MRKEENVATFTISKKTEEEIAQKKTASEKTNPPSGAFNISKKTDSAPVYAPTLEEERANERDKMLTPSVSRQVGKTSAPQSEPKRSLGSRVASGVMSGLITEGANIANAGGVQADLRGGTEMSGIYREQVHSLDLQIAALEKTLKDPSMTEKDRADTMEALSVARSQRDIYDKAVRSGEGTAKGLYETADAGYRAAQEYGEKSLDGTKGIERKILGFVPGATQIGAEIATGVAPVIRAISSGGANAAQYRYQVGDEYNAQDAATRMALSAAGVAAGSILSRGVNESGLKLLRTLGKQNYVLPNIALGGASALGYAAGETGLTELSKAITDENYTPDWNSIGKTAVSAFAFGAITRAIDTARVSIGNKRYMKTLNENVQERYNYAKRVIEDPRATAQQKAQGAKSVMDAADKMRYALDELQVVGAQKEVNAMQEFLLSIYGEMLPYTKTNAGGISGAGEIVPVTPAATPPAQVTPAEAAQLPVSQFPAAPSPVAPAAAGRAAIEATAPKTVVPAPVAPAPVQKTPDLPLASEQSEQKAQAGEITPSTADAPQNAAHSAGEPIANGFSKKQMERLSGTFGENGAKAFRTSMTDYAGDAIRGYAQFTKLYNEGKKRGKTVDTSPAEILKTIEETPELSPEQRYAAFVSGMNDASAPELKNIAPEPVAQREESGTMESAKAAPTLTVSDLAERLKTNTVTEDGAFRYSVERKGGRFPVYVGSIREISGTDAYATDARAARYVSQNFKTYEEAVADLVAVARNSGFIKASDEAQGAKEDWEDIDGKAIGAELARRKATGQSPVGQMLRQAEQIAEKQTALAKKAEKKPSVNRKANEIGLPVVETSLEPFGGNAGIVWNDESVLRKTDNEYLFKTIDAAVIGNEVFFRFRGAPKGSSRKYAYAVIRDFKQYTANEVLFDIAQRSKDPSPYPLGRHFEDLVREIWKQNGLSQGFAPKITRDATTKEEMTNEPAGVDRGSEVSGTGGDVGRAVSEGSERPAVSGNVQENGGSGENGERNEQSGGGLGRVGAGNAERNAPAAAENPAGAGWEPVTAAPVKKPAKMNKNNYRITEDIDSTRPRYEDNLAAIKLLKQLEAEGRKATEAERAILAKYKGWGGLKDAILGYRRGELQHLLTKEEYEAAKDSIINAHYTSTKVISGIYKAVARMGFTGGNILEPSMGVGNFFGMLPKNMSARSNLYGVELDKITGQIAQNLYPDAKIDIAGFQDVLYPDNTFDLVVGNVPFSNDVRIPYRGEKYNLHDFFFVKALDETRPGGVLALITSTGTLDKINGKTQSAIAKRANLIAAFRLPDNAFKTNAGTSVTTDLIFLQKKGDGIADNGTAFTRVGTIDGIPINEYFVDHPKNILGTLAYEKGMYADNRTVVHATPDFETRFEKAMNSLPKGLMTADGAASAPAPVTAKKRGVREKTTFTKTKDGVSIGTAGGKTESVSGKSAEIAAEYLKIKSAYFSLIDAERAGNLDAAEQYRDTLNKLYDSFVKKYGPISKNEKLLKQDDDYIRVSGLEVVQKKGSIGKSAIFTTPTISRAKKTRAGSSEEALSISLNEDGKINLEHMAALTGKSPETVLKELDDEIIQTPDGEYVLTSQYLSGNIYEKLDAVQGKKGFERQEALLKASIPTPKTAKDISAELGSHWIPAKYVAEFIRDTFSTYGYIDVEYNKELGQWDLGKFYTPVQKYSTERVSATDIIKNTLNGKNISVYDKDSDDRRILNKKATEAAQQKQNDLREAFRKWIFADNARRTDLEGIFNRTLNAYAPMDYKGLSERIDFGISPDSKIKPRDYQKEAVARIVFGGNTLLHHGVGTGKTATMIMSAHVLKQSGISNKPMFVVPNGKVNDFRNEILGLYPDANILALDNKSMSPSELQHTKSMIATGDWDYVIIYRTAFEKIPVSPDTEAAFIQAQLDDMETALRENGGKKNGTTRFEKDLTTRKQTLEERLKAALDRPKDNSLNFEDLGIDALFIDEAHNYKKVGFATTHTISGIDSSTNNITTDLLLKENYIRNHGGRIVLATATPLTNTLSEMYNMTLHVNPEALRSAGIYSFDGWLNTFADIQSQPEIAPDGKTWRIKERVRGFKSGNELIGIYRQFADVKQTKDVVDDLPKAEFIDVVSEGTEYHQRLLDNFAERSGKPKDGKDNMLLITSDGRAAGTDLRLLTGLLQELYPGITADELDLPGSKINRAVENIVKEYNASTPTKGTQFVFLDVGIHDSDGRYAFNLYKDLIDKLAANGIPREQIANIQDYDGEEKRSGLYEAMNKGDIRVLIGSTAKMGEGVNAQNKSVALHHLNVPYRPDNLEQREGRTIRHGNENKNVRIYRYIQEKSFDSYLWQMIERKANYVAQALNGGDATSLEESSEAIVNAREAKAIATGNPLIMEKVELQDKIGKLKLLQSSFYDDQRRAAQRIASNEAKIKELQTELTQAKKDAATVTKHKTDDFSMTVGGKTYYSRKEAGEAIAAHKDVGKIGSLYGMDVFRDSANEVSLRGAGKYSVELGDSPDGNITRLVNVATKNILNAEARITRSIDALNVNTKDAQETVNSKFSRQDELDAAVKRQNEVDRELGIVENEVSFDDVAADGADAFAYAENIVTPDRSDQWSAERVGDGKKPKRLAEIIEQIHHDFDVNITTGHIRGKNVLGKFSHRDQGIRARIANDLPTIAHELGHYFDFTYGLTKNGLSAKLKSELTDNLSDEMKAVYKKEKHVTEGLAEFMRKFLQNRETAAIDYPEFTAYFLGRLTPKDLALIEQLADDVNAYYSLDAETATSSIRFKEEKNPDARTTAEKIKDTSDRWYQDWVDALHSIKQFDDDTGSDVYKLAINSLYKDAVAGAIITGDLTDKNGQYVSPGLKDVLRGINLKDKEEYRLFNEYLVVKHGPERLREGKRIFADDRKNSTNWMNDRAAALEAQHPQFKKAAERLYRFQRDFKKTWLVGTGLLSDEMSKDWDDRWEFYVPLNRAVDMQKRGIGAKRGFANQSNPIKRASERGSGLDIISPVDNIIDNIIRVVNAGMQNDVMLQLTNAAIRTGADATIMEKIPTPMKKTIFSLGGVKEQLGDAGDAALSEGKFDTNAFNQFNEIVSGLDDVIAQYSKGKSHDNIITVLRNGETEFWKINDPLLLSSLMNLSPARSNALLEMYGSITRFMTATATGTNVVWSITSNFPRDLQTLLVYSEGKNRLSVIPAMAKAYLNAFKKDNADPLYKEYLAMGGGQTSVYTADRNVARNMRAKLAGDKMRWLNPMEWIAFISETVESGPRYATYKLMREKGMTPQEAIYASHDITVNFRRGGVRSRELNKVIPFFNAGVQGLDKFARWQTAQDVPLNGRKSAARTRFFTFLAVNVALGALFYGINNADEEKKEDYQQLSNYTKNNYWLFPLGDGEYFAIPKARELSVLASFTETALERTVGGNKHAFDEFYDYVIDTTLPGLISDLAKGDWEGAVGTVGILGVGAYIMANRDFLGKPIESAGMQYLEAKDRYNNRTSKIAYALGQALDASPQKIDYFFQQTFGGFWKAQKALMPVGGENVDVTLGVQNQYIKDNQYSTDLVNWLYDKADASAKAKKSNPADMEKAITATMDDRMTSFYSNYNKASKGEESTASTRGTRQVVLTMINEYRKASDSGALTTAQKAVYAVCKQENSTDYLPSTMQPTVKDGAGKTHTLSGVDYVEFQLNYNRLYWEYVEDNINRGKSAAEKAAICTAAKSTAKADAINRIAASHGWAKTEDAEKYKGVNADAVVRFKAYLDIANDDGSLTQDEVIAAIDRLTLSKEQSSVLFHSKYDSDKNNPYK